MESAILWFSFAIGVPLYFYTQRNIQAHNVGLATLFMFLVYIVVLQQIEGNLIYPKVVGSSMGLPAIWVLAAVTIGGGVMGIIGMLIGVPLAATVYRLLREDVNHDRKAEIESV